MPFSASASVFYDRSTDSRWDRENPTYEVQFNCDDTQLVTDMDVWWDSTNGISEITLVADGVDVDTQTATVSTWQMLTFDITTPFACDSIIEFESNVSTDFIGVTRIDFNDTIANNPLIVYANQGTYAPMITFSTATATTPEESSPVVTPVFFIDYLATSTCEINASGTICTHEYDQATTSENVAASLDKLTESLLASFLIVLFFMIMLMIFFIISTFKHTPL